MVKLNFPGSFMKSCSYQKRSLVKMFSNALCFVMKDFCWIIAIAWIENVGTISCFLQYFKILFQHYPWLWINSTWIMSVYLNKIGHLSRKKLFHQLQKKYWDVWRVHFISLHKQLRFPYPAKYQQRIFIPLSTISTFCFEFKNDLFLFFLLFFFFANYVKAVIRFRNRRGEN